MDFLAFFPCKKNRFFFRRASRANFSLAVLLFQVFDQMFGQAVLLKGGGFNINRTVVDLGSK